MVLAPWRLSSLGRKAPQWRSPFADNAAKRSKRASFYCGVKDSNFFRNSYDGEDLKNYKYCSVVQLGSGKGGKGTTPHFALYPLKILRHVKNHDKKQFSHSPLHPSDGRAVWGREGGGKLLDWVYHPWICH